MGALTGVSSGPLTAILRIIQIHLKPSHKAAQQIHINSNKNPQFSVICEMRQERVQLSVLSTPLSDVSFTLPPYLSKEEKTALVKPKSKPLEKKDLREYFTFHRQKVKLTCPLI